MKTLQGRLLVLALGLLLLLMTACGTTGTTGTGGNGTPSSGNGGGSPSQVLQKSFTAMKQLKTAHIDMKLSDTTSTSSTAATPSTTPGGTPHQFSVTVTGNGDEVLPDKISLHLTIGGGEAIKSTSIAETIIGKNLYIQNSKGQWYVIDTSKMQGSSNPLSGTNAATYNKLLDIAQKAQLTDHGTENVNGVSLRHITATFGKDALQQLLQATGSSNSTLANSINLKQATVDFWVDESTSYTHKIELKLNIGLNSSATATVTPATGSANITSTLDSTINYSKFNDSSITVTAPPNAIPTNNILKAFQ